jgi:hypothetical protein
MLHKRQAGILDSRGHAAQVTALACEYPAGHTLRWDFHEWDQLVYASRGVTTLRTGDGVWVVPTHRAVWIPVGILHSIGMSGAVAMRTLYVRPGLAKIRSQACCVVNISPLLRELILHCLCYQGAAEKELQGSASRAGCSGPVAGD